MRKGEGGLAEAGTISKPIYPLYLDDFWSGQKTCMFLTRNKAQYIVAMFSKYSLETLLQGYKVWNGLKGNGE